MKYKQYIIGLLASIWGFCAYNINVFAVDINNILPVKKNVGEGKLPDHDLFFWIERFIDLIMKSAYTIAVVMMVYAAFLYIYDHGTNSEAKKAVDVFIYSAVGFIIITISYALVHAITQIEWHL